MDKKHPIQECMEKHGVEIGLRATVAQQAQMITWLKEERDELRAQLAERDALLVKAAAHVQPTCHELYAELTRALSASAEPSAPKCETCSDYGAVGNILNAEPCPDCSYSAPIERDERAEFKREARYFVIKLKDLELLSPIDRDLVQSYMGLISATMESWGTKSRQCVVVESDWPEYEATWAAIEARAALERK